MKKNIGICLLSLPIAAAAQNYDDIDQAAMQRMMQQAQNMQACMADIDTSAMEAFQKQAQAMDVEVKILCAAGKRDAAMNRAMKFAQEAASNPIMQQIKQCGETMQHMLPQSAMATADDKEPGRHICDGR